jgi:hypothetical protein
VGDKFIVGSGDEVYMRIDETENGNAVGISGCEAGWIFRFRETRKIVRCEVAVTVVS